MLCPLLRGRPLHITPHAGSTPCQVGMIGTVQMLLSASGCNTAPVWDLFWDGKGRFLPHLPTLLQEPGNPPGPSPIWPTPHTHQVLLVFRMRTWGILSRCKVLYFRKQAMARKAECLILLVFCDLVAITETRMRPAERM